MGIRYTNAMRKSIMIVAAALSAGVFAMPEGFTDDWDAALKKAESENKNVLALFTGSDWCIWCKRLEGEIFSKKEFSDNVGKTFVPVFLDFPSDKSLVPEATAKRNKELSRKYKVRGYPSVLILDAKGEVLAETGYDKCGPTKYLEKLNSLAKNGPLLKKHIKPYEEKFMKLGRKFDADMRAEIKKATDKGVDKKQAEKDALKKLAGSLSAEIAKLKKEFEAEKMPDAIAGDKAELIGHLDGAIKTLDRLAKGEK